MRISDTFPFSDEYQLAKQLNDVNDVEQALTVIADGAGLPTRDLQLDELAAHLWRCGEIGAEIQSENAVRWTERQRMEQPDAHGRRALLELVGDIERLAELAKGVGVSDSARDVPRRGRPQSLDRVRAGAAASIWLEQIGSPERRLNFLDDWCQVEGIDLKERTIRTVASEAIRKQKERRGRPS